MRNGFLPRREILTGIGPVEVQVPKARDRAGRGRVFRSELVPRWLARERSAGEAAVPPERAPARAPILQCLFEGLKLRETREPDLDRALLSAALHEFVPLLLKPQRR